MSRCNSSSRVELTLIEAASIIMAPILFLMSRLPGPPNICALDGLQRVRKVACRNLASLPKTVGGSPRLLRHDTSKCRPSSGIDCQEAPATCSRWQQNHMMRFRYERAPGMTLRASGC